MQFSQKLKAIQKSNIWYINLSSRSRLVTVRKHHVQRIRFAPYGSATMISATAYGSACYGLHHRYTTFCKNLIDDFCKMIHIFIHDHG